MSILRVANLQFNASGTKRIDYDAVADDGIIKISADAVKLPVGDTASRPTLQPGMLRYNSQLDLFEGANSTTWGSIGGTVDFATANGWANTVGTAGNNYTNAVGLASNNYINYVGASANSYATTMDTAGNNYTNSVGLAGNNYTNVVGLAGNNYVNSVVFPAANTALQNTTGTFAGDLRITGNVIANKQLTVTYTPTTTVNAAITAAAANSQGGTGYADFLRVTNLSGGATNPNKTFRLNSTGGIEIINSAYTATIFTLDNNGILATSPRGITSSSMPAGTILQVQQAFYSAATTLASGTFTDYPGLSITITPSSSTSKFFLMYHLQMTLYGTTIMSRFLRNSTAVGVGDAAGSRNQSTTGWLFPSGDSNHQACPMVGFYLDSPATASAITYKVQAKTQTSGTAYINYAASNADNSDWAHRSTSSFTIFEVAV